MAQTPWRVTADGERQWRGVDGNWYVSEALALEAGVAKPRPAVPPAPARPVPGIYRRPARASSWKTQLARGLTGIWIIGVVVAFTAGGTGWGVAVLVLPPALSFGIAKAVVDDRNRISKVGGRGVGGALQCPKCRGTQFTAKRSAGGKVGLGLLAPKTRVKCVTCGAQFTRG